MMRYILASYSRTINVIIISLVWDGHLDQSDIGLRYIVTCTRIRSADTIRWTNVVLTCLLGGPWTVGCVQANTIHWINLHLSTTLAQQHCVEVFWFSAWGILRHTYLKNTPSASGTVTLPWLYDHWCPTHHIAFKHRLSRIFCITPRLTGAATRSWNEE